MSAKKLENLLKPNENGDLASVVRRAREMGDLTEALTQSLPMADRAAIVAANIREDGELVVICASSAWAAKIRFIEEQLLDAARQAGAHPTACRVRTTTG